MHFAAVLWNGSVFTLGDENSCEDSSNARMALLNDDRIFLIRYSITAVLKTRNAVIWGSKDSAIYSNNANVLLLGIDKV